MGHFRELHRGGVFPALPIGIDIPAHHGDPKTGHRHTLQQRQDERQQGKNVGRSIDNGHGDPHHQPGEDIPLGKRPVAKRYPGVVIPVIEEEAEDKKQGDQYRYRVRYAAGRPQIVMIADILR